MPYYLLYIAPIFLIIVINLVALVVGMKILLSRKRDNAGTSRRESIKVDILTFITFYYFLLLIYYIPDRKKDKDVTNCYFIWMFPGKSKDCGYSECYSRYWLDSGCTASHTYRGDDACHPTVPIRYYKCIPGMSSVGAHFNYGCLFNFVNHVLHQL